MFSPQKVQNILNKLTIRKGYLEKKIMGVFFISGKKMNVHE